jgi:hypothetical protein
MITAKYSSTCAARPSGVDHDGGLAYQSPGCVGADRGVMFDDPWNAGPRPGDVDAVLTGDRFG